MKITDVTVWPLLAPITHLANNPVSVPNPEVTGGLIFKGYRSVIVRVDTDAGLYGVGEGLVRLAPRATMEIIKECKSVLIGRDPHETEYLWADLYSLMMNRGHNRGFMLEAIAALDIALWDIRAKACDLPLYRLLGGHDQAVSCYASSIRIKDPETSADEARDLVADGFDGIKLKIGRGKGKRQDDLAAIEAVRAAIGPNVKLMVDGNCGFSFADAVWLGKKMDLLDIAWFEEPFTPDNLAGYRALRKKIDTPLAAGETWFTRYDFREALVAECIDIAQPDVSRSGGVTEARRIATLASTFHIDFAPHTGQSSIICLMTALHLAASIPDVLSYEFISTDWSSEETNPLRTQLGAPQLNTLRDGPVVRLPEGAGIGIDLDWGILDRYAIKP